MEIQGTSQMNIVTIIKTLREEIDNTFRRLNNWMQEEEQLKFFKVNDECWSISQVLEHISLTNHYLLILIQKSAKKAFRKSTQVNLEKELDQYDFYNPDLELIGKADAFRWESPVHMVPEGRSSDDVTRKLHSQNEQLLDILHQLKNGEGILHKTVMSVYQLGKLDVYQYIHFLVLHAKRHIEQMEKIKKTYHAKHFLGNSTKF